MDTLFALCISVHGFALRIESDHPEVIAALERRLEAFRSPGSARADILFRFQVHPPADVHPAPVRPAGARLVCALPGGAASYDAASDRLFYDYGPQVRASCDPRAGEALIEIDASAANPISPASGQLFALPLLEILKRRSYYPIHAAGLGCGRHGVVVAGETGAGKTTLTVALLRGGFGYMGDDTLFLRESESSSPEVRAFPETLDLSLDALRLFPGLSAPARHNGAKVPVRARDPGAAEPVWSRPGSVLLFPEVGPSETTRVTPLSRKEALHRLLPNVWLTDVRSSQAHVDSITRLVREGRCFRMETGRDLDRIPDLIRDLLS